MIKNITYVIAISLLSLLEATAADSSRESTTNLASQVYSEDVQLLRKTTTLLIDAIVKNDVQGAGQAILDGAALMALYQITTNLLCH
ncbi:hypothetical protein KG892_02670 [Vermiphilus pyriformis]|nr:MAG: hypothetical protein KG892_02670 [Vermiphilus pyriformis]